MLHGRLMRRGVHGPTLGDGVKGIAMMTGEISRPHSVSYRAITDLWTGTAALSTSIQQCEGVRLFSPQAVGGADVIYIYLFILLLLYSYITFNKAVTERGFLELRFGVATTASLQPGWAVP